MPTPAPTPIPQAVQQQAAARLTSAVYLGGATRPTAGQSFDTRLTFEVRNPLNVPLNYGNTVELSAGPGGTVIAASANVGTVTNVGSGVLWGGFMLVPGEVATLSVDIRTLVSTCTPNQPVTVVSNVRTTATTTGIGTVDVSSGPLTSGVVTGLSSTTCAAPAPAPVQPAPRPAVTVSAPAPVATLPRSGVGLSADTPLSLRTLAPVLLLLIVGGAGVARRRRQVQRTRG